MSISSTVKALISMTGVKQGDLAPVLGVKSVQAVSNKFRLGQWKAADLVSIAGHCGCRLCFVMPDGTVLPITADDPVGAGGAQGVPGGCFWGSAGGLVSPLSTDGEEKPLTD